MHRSLGSLQPRVSLSLHLSVAHYAYLYLMITIFFNAIRFDGSNDVRCCSVSSIFYGRTKVLVRASQAIYLTVSLF